MKIFSCNRPQTPGSSVVRVLLLGLLSGGLHAGEPIQFTNGKVLPKAKRGSSLTREIESGPSEGAAVRGLDIVIPSFAMPSLNPKDEKRRKEAQVERQNWMILDQGELQEEREEDERFGIREDSIEKEKAAGDVWFSPRDDEANRGRGSGRSSTTGPRPPGQSRPMPPGANRARNAAVASQKPPESESKTSVLTGSDGQGAHISSELNPRNLFGADRASSAQGGDKSARSFRDLFGGTGSADTERIDRSPVKGLGVDPTRNSLGFDGRLDVRPPAALPAFAPASSGFFDASSRSSAGGSSFGQDAGSSAFRSGGSFGSAAASDSFSARGSTFNGSSPALQPSSSQRAVTSREFFERPKMVNQ